MQLTLNIPDPVAQRVIDALCYHYGYGPSSGLTKAQYARAMVIRHVKQIVGQVESSEAVEIARVDSLGRVETEINIT